MATGNLSRQQTKTHLALINAAIQLIHENGYDALTIQAITDRADYGRRVFYMHFENKEDILYHIVTRWLAKTTDAIFEQVKHYPTPEREYRALKLIMKAAFDSRHFVRQIGSAMEKDGLNRRIKDFAIQDVKKHIQLGNFALYQDMDVDMVSHLHASTMMEFVRSMFIKSESIDLDQQVNDFFRYTFRQEPPNIT